ncbi:MarR family winged helix-turn-helix transcriptional regulator [Candidatus Mycolicibacterium alkanivorans]|uniref:MarR family transcriptional regulator n=1 Tax=Candidatus Mycolicibacterium alkanivorans TaxID=2954114 RepID=A0ABS9YZT7_9MYCO|nr:MarR family transcriptional regulator [Candidatus Mycolicibacterium alkanivorans]MCI4676432.1 MarR family transcriptional regulator [Candidatus Mycolicibacterium alkanivorans]
MVAAHKEPIGYLLHQLASALRAEVTSGVLEPLGLTFPQYICLRVLSKLGDRSNAELARDTGVSPQAMNMVLRSLEERHLVARPSTVDSGRSLPASLTRSGRDLLARTDAGVKDAEQRLLAKLSAEQRREFRTILAVLGSQ